MDKSLPEVGAVTTARSTGTNAPPGRNRRGAGPPYKALFILAAVLIAATLVVLVAIWPKGGSGGGTPKAGGSWHQIWRDDFNGPAGQVPDKSTWIMEKGYRYPNGPDHWGTREVQHYNDLPEDVSTDGKGHLLITPHLDVHNTWESARIETRRSDFQPPAGGVLRAEAGIRLPAVTGKDALGYWPAFWMLGAGIRDDTSTWPAHGEFDILENVNGDQRVHGTLHCGVENGGPCNEPNGLGQETTCPGSPCQGNFHTYALEWDRGSSPEELRWYVDGTLFHSVRSSEVDANAWADATHGGMTIILNVAIGGDFPDGVSHQKTPTAGTKSGSPMVIDYVSVSTKG
jgi:hypothetical protein